jgi:glycosyltransferase involved in cell wall biosynthesis
MQQGFFPSPGSLQDKKPDQMKIFMTADAEIPVPPRLYGGIERIIASLIEEYRRRGHEVALAARADSTAEVDYFLGWPVGTSAGFSAFRTNAFALQKAVREFRPDIIHSFSRLLWLLPLLGSDIPRIMSYQRPPTGLTVAWSNRLHGRMLQFTGCSEHIAETGRSHGGGRWSAIPNFIDIAKFTFVPSVPADAPLVFLSRIESIKGVHNAIAVARASGRKLVIAGNKVESMEGIRYWESQVAPWIGRDGIEYVGPVDDVAKNALLGRAAAMIVPIEWEEPFGIVFAEALACGTPVISTRRGSLPEIVREGVTGFFIDSTESGVQAVNRLNSLDRAACRQDAVEHFSLDRISTRYLALYENAVKGY